MKVAAIQSAFNWGEFSPLMYGQVRFERYDNALALCENFIPTIQGGLTRRPGTYFVEEVKDSAKATRLVPFEFSTTQAYIIEFGDEYLRFYMDHGQILTRGDDEFVTNTTFATDISGWTDLSTGGGILSWDSGVGGRMKLDSTSGNARAGQTLTGLVSGETYTVRATGATNVDIRIGTAGYGTFDLLAVSFGSGTQEYTFVASGSTAYVRLGNNSGTISYFEDFSVIGPETTATTTYEIDAPWGEQHLFDLRFTQSADVLYITHPSYAPRKLLRHGHSNWEIQTIDFKDGPYLSTNATVTTLAPSATSGNGITITAGPARTITGAADNGSGEIRITAVGHGYATGVKVHIAGVTGTTEANGDWTITVIDADHFDLDGSTFVNAYVSGGTARFGVFAITDIGRLVRIQHSSTWGYATIVGYTDVSRVTADVESNFGATTAQTAWRLGAWSDTTGYPVCVTFYEDRLFFGGSVSFPTRIDGSKSGDYENFAPTSTAGVVANDNAVAFTLNSNAVDAVRWLVGDEKGLLIGTVGSEWVMRPSSQSEALSPTNITAKPATPHGSAQVQPLRVGKSVLFVQRSGRKVRDYAYVFEVDGFRSPDVTTFAEHITKGGLVEMAYQQEPIGTVWAAREDGVLLSCLFNREQDAIGWGRHILGGSFGSGDAVVESVASIPSPDGTYNEVWLIVKRTVNSATQRYVEFMTKLFNTDDGDTVEDAFYVDCGLTYDGAPTTTVTGLSHLEGQVVTVLADGAAHPDRTVASGAITLARSSSKVHVGLGYNSNGQTLRYEVGAADGTAQGKTQRISRIAFRFHETVGCKFGPDEDNLDEITFRMPSDPMDQPVPLFSGDKSQEWPGGYFSGAQIYFRQEQPLPFTLLGVFPILTTYDR